ncbi:MAG: DUF58 domain-containing protein, partial [Victivallales bacterium]|nr:DUF58 domain-containing protein [Victivallales bacterium]
MNENFRYWQKLAYILLIAGIVFCWLPGGAALFGLGLALCVHLLGALSRTERFLKESRQNLRVISRSILKDRSVVEKDVTEELCLQWQGKAPLDLCLLETIPLPGLEYQGKVKHGLFFPANQEVRVTNTLRSHTAGRLSLGEVRAKISDDWGLFEVERSLEAPCQPIFYPPVYQKLQLSPQVAMGLSPMLGIHRLSRAGEGSELHEIRDYQSGDSYRKMLWGATARSGRLMVRDFAAEVNIPVVFVLNTSWYLRFGSPKMMFDQLVETAMVLADATYEAGDPFGFCLYGDQEFPMHVSCVLPAHRRHQVTELMKSLLQIRAHQAPPPVLNLPELEKSVRKLLVGRAESLQSYYKHSSLDKELVRQGLAPQGFEKTDDLQYAAVLAQIANRFGLPTPVLHSHFKASDSVEYQLECEEIERLDKLLVRLIPQIKDKALFVVSMRPYES